MRTYIVEQPLFDKYEERSHVAVRFLSATEIETYSFDEWRELFADEQPHWGYVCCVGRKGNMVVVETSTPPELR